MNCLLSFEGVEQTIRGFRMFDLKKSSFDKDHVVVYITSAAGNFSRQ